MVLSISFSKLVESNWQNGLSSDTTVCQVYFGHQYFTALLRSQSGCEPTQLSKAFTLTCIEYFACCLNGTT